MIMTRRTNARADRRRGPALPARPGEAGGFTLMELLVVIGVIALVATAAVPSIWHIFSAGSAAQAYNMMAAQLTAARAEAVQSEKFAGVHVQFADSTRTDIKNACFTGVVRYSGGAEGSFGGVGGYLPRRIPGSMAFGELPRPAADVNGEINTRSNFDNFTSFTVVFSPAGAAVRQTPRTDGAVFFDAGNALFSGATKLWNSDVANVSGNGEGPATAMTLFDYAEMEKSGDRGGYLGTYSEYLPVNVHTGQLFPRE
jgi:prepilin-type N-terminal cleavage/methylation domain-containing protein